MKQIFFGCSMRGGDSFVKRSELAKLPEIIESLGHKVISKHQSQDNFFEAESKLSNCEIHDRDYKWLQKADVGIFEISNPSLGVGSEIADMLHLEKSVLCLYKKTLENTISAFVLGMENSNLIEGKMTCQGYNDMEDAKEKIKIFLKDLAK